MPRRGLSITAVVDTRIQRVRGMLLSEGLDLTYTQTIQVLALIGADALVENNSFPDWKEKLLERVRDYARRAGLRL